MWTPMTLWLHAHACLQCKVPRQCFIPSWLQGRLQLSGGEHSLLQQHRLRTEHTNHSATEAHVWVYYLIGGCTPESYMHYDFHICTMIFIYTFCIPEKIVFSDYDQHDCNTLSILDNDDRCVFIYLLICMYIFSYFTECGTFRYDVDRCWVNPSQIVFFMLHLPNVT